MKLFTTVASCVPMNRTHHIPRCDCCDSMSLTASVLYLSRKCIFADCLENGVHLIYLSTVGLKILPQQYEPNQITL